ncbi:MAG TPA: AAA family ATPase, partial [Polyangiales bacterium]|nr:AAA family ATPase [Polyangiales bacterium]
LHSRRRVHADISPRNVRCTLDGRAKLLDFGAMMPMGVAKRIVGTPPFIAPEMLHLQTLDGRTDLFAFGAIAYLVLTGRLAYPANDVSQLHDLWRAQVRPPAQLDPQIPAALSELVTELIQINPNARPRSAGIVMERLCSIAGLPFEESAEVADAYLATPTLVGREAQLGRARELLASTMRGRGGVLIASAPAGGGRSRFLDACVLEAKLLGLQVVRVDPAAVEHAPYGAATALFRQLFEIAPEVCRAAAQLHPAELAHLVGPELSGTERGPKPPDRTQLLAALRDFGASVTRSLRVLITIDDAERIDEASSSSIVALGQKAARRALCLALTIETDSVGSAALDVLAPLAERIELPALTEPQTEELLSSVFGDAKNSIVVARRVHTLARGNPRATMQFARHLVEQGIARYEAGSFILPERLREQDLPSLAAAYRLRAERLDPDARELARILALTDPSELANTDYVALTSHHDRARTYRAIDHLVLAQVLETHAERYRLSDPTWTTVLTADIDQTERIALHAQLARVFERSGTLTRRSHHLMESDQAEAAIRLMLAQFIKDPNEPKDPLADYVP